MLETDDAGAAPQALFYDPLLDGDRQQKLRDKKAAARKPKVGSESVLGQMVRRSGRKEAGAGRQGVRQWVGGQPGNPRRVFCQAEW